LQFQDKEADTANDKKSVVFGSNFAAGFVPIVRVLEETAFG
jgi:hypothetical protein